MKNRIKHTLHIVFLLFGIFVFIFCYKIISAFSTDTSRVHFIESFGWQVEQTHFMHEKIKIPVLFGETELEYNKILKKAGFDLENYKGKTLDKFSYRLLNHPQDKKYAYINIFIYKNNIVAADVVSPLLNGSIRAINDKE